MIAGPKKPKNTVPGGLVRGTPAQKEEKLSSKQLGLPNINNSHDDISPRNFKDGETDPADKESSSSSWMFRVISENNG